jgi:phosphotriesterase-related protein
MQQQLSSGKVQTVLGIIDADNLGITLMHEHLLHDMTVYFVEPATSSDRCLAYENVCMDNLWWVRLNESSNMDNLRLTDEQLATKEAMLYKLATGDTVVELTTTGFFGRDPLGLVRISRATGLNIVMGTGYDSAPLHPPQLATRTEEDITEEIVRDITIGVANTGIRAGIIGEIGCSTLEESERKVLRSCAAAQQRTGVAISIHPSPSDDLVLEIVRILANAGADLNRTIIGHVDVTGFSRATCHELADAGCFLGFDNFGLEGLLQLPGLGHAVELSDMQRINNIIHLITDGYLNKIIVSQDISTKHRLTSYGGLGYAHIIRDIVPVMRLKGISDVHIHALLVENPKQILSLPGTY